MRSTPMLLAMLPTALAVQLSELAYSPPEDLAMKAMSADNSCVLPKGYIIKDFKAKSNDTGKILSSLDFTFIDDATKVTTICHFNSTSKSTTPPGLTPRFACENGEVKFIWEDNDKELWMIERVCSEGDGIANYEVSGSIRLTLACQQDIGSCLTNATSQDSKFTSIQPVRDPTL